MLQVSACSGRSERNDSGGLPHSKEARQPARPPRLANASSSGKDTNRDDAAAPPSLTETAAAIEVPGYEIRVRDEIAADRVSLQLESKHENAAGKTIEMQVSISPCPQTSDPSKLRRDRCPALEPTAFTKDDLASVFERDPELVFETFVETIAGRRVIGRYALSVAANRALHELVLVHHDGLRRIVVKAYPRSKGGSATAPTEGALAQEVPKKQLMVAATEAFARYARLL